MAKRDTTTRNADQTKGGGTGSTSGTDSAEDRVIALAEQLGRIVGTLQAKAGGWLDRDALAQQLSQVRDGATHLLETLGVAGSAEGGAGAEEIKGEATPKQESAARRTTSSQPASQPASRNASAGGRQKTTAGASAGAGRQNNEPTSRGRSGGVVDAPGKKHRKPVPNETRPVAADVGRVAKMKMVNGNRRRGR